MKSNQFFKDMLIEKKLKQSDYKTSDNLKKLGNWMKENYKNYLMNLVELIEHNQVGIQIPAFNSFLQMLSKEIETKRLLKMEKIDFPLDIFREMILKICCLDNLQFSLLEGVKQIYCQYDDIRFYMLICLR